MMIHECIHRGSQTLFLAAFLWVSLAGCAGRYFRDVEEPTRPLLRYGLSELPFSEYWTGIVFNGRKIGFSHFAISPHPGQEDYFEIRSEAVMRFRFFMMDKKIVLRSYDLVDKDLCLKRFAYEYDIDGNKLELTGFREDDTLRVIRTTQGASSEEETQVKGELYPACSVYLYPFLKGIRVGNRYQYLVYNGETQSIDTVCQEVQSYQQSDLFSGEAYRVQTRYHGQTITTWLDHRGLPVLETALGGVLVSGLESEQEAGRYLLESALNRDEDLLNFSLIRISNPLPDARSSTYLEIYIGGLPEDMALNRDLRQECSPSGGGYLCRVRARTSGCTQNECSEDQDAYLNPSPAVPLSSEIVDLAERITRGASSQMDRIHLILAWMRDNIAREPVDVFTALDVLYRRKAECQGHALLYAAFARSLGIPTRVANGIVYAEDYQGFLYHAWAESFVQGKWVAVDPTLSQVPADATHVKLLEGEALSALVPLVGVIGKISIEVIEIR